MPNIKKIVTLLNQDFPYAFIEGQEFVWSSSNQTISHPAISTVADIFYLLHEVAHAELHHQDFTADVELVRIEAEAWRHAETLGRRYGLNTPQDIIEDALDSYRHWLYSRSLCPDCGQTGAQTQNTYRCLNCRCVWRANDARTCRLQRIKLPSRNRP